MLLFILLIIIVLLLNITKIKCLIDCVDVINSNNKFNGECNNKWINLKPYILPTQLQVGYSWIQYKLDSDFTSENNAQNEINKSIIPGVLGPNNKIYIVDDHHTLCALDYSGYDTVSVTFNILCDKRDLSESIFWSEMNKGNLAFLLSHPKNEPNSQYIQINYNQLPKTFSFTSSLISFEDDPWRSLSGFSRKVEEAAPPAPTCNSNSDKYCERCFYRGCLDGSSSSGPSVPYFEFLLLYFMIDATFYNNNLWPSLTEYKDFYQSYSELQISIMGNVNILKWQNVATKVISLCRSSSVATYNISKEYFPTSSGNLPGYVVGYIPLPSDPTCDQPTC